MTGTHSRNGDVTITFNSQGEKLAAGDGLFYFPCDVCGKVETVGAAVVSITCGSCAALTVNPKDEALLADAALVIKRAEDDLGPLSKGQKVDLLLDNLPELEGCADATAIVERLEWEKHGGRA
jgi:hypothetical protein